MKGWDRLLRNKSSRSEHRKRRSKRSRASSYDTLLRKQATRKRTSLRPSFPHSHKREIKPSNPAEEKDEMRQAQDQSAVSKQASLLGFNVPPCDRFVLLSQFAGWTCDRQESNFCLSLLQFWPGKEVSCIADDSERYPYALQGGDHSASWLPFRSANTCSLGVSFALCQYSLDRTTKPSTVRIVRCFPAPHYVSKQVRDSLRVCMIAIGTKLRRRTASSTNLMQTRM